MIANFEILNSEPHHLHFPYKHFHSNCCSSRWGSFREQKASFHMQVWASQTDLLKRFSTWRKKKQPKQQCLLHVDDFTVVHKLAYNKYSVSTRYTTGLIYHTLFLFIYLNSIHVVLNNEPCLIALRHRSDYTACISGHHPSPQNHCLSENLKTNNTYSVRNYNMLSCVYKGQHSAHTVRHLAHDTGRVAAGLYS